LLNYILKIQVVYFDICKNSKKSVRGELVEPYEPKKKYLMLVRILRQAQDERRIYMYFTVNLRDTI